MSKENKFELLYKRINVTTLLLLKLFDYEIKTSYKKIDKGKLIMYPIHYITFIYGLKQSYLNVKKDKNNNNYFSLVLVFNKKTALTNKEVTVSYYESFIDRLISSDCFIKRYKSNKNDFTIIELRINKKYNKDIEHIINSKYSKTSIPFKQKMKMEYSKINNSTKVPYIGENEFLLQKYIVLSNIPYKIVNKHENLKREIEDIFQTKIEDDNNTDYFKKFEIDKEFWNKNKDKYV